MDIEKGTKKIGDIIAENNEIIKSTKGVKFIPIGRSYNRIYPY